MKHRKVCWKNGEGEGGGGQPRFFTNFGGLYTPVINSYRVCYTASQTDLYLKSNSNRKLS